MNIRRDRQGDASLGTSMWEAAILGPVLVWSPCLNIRRGNAMPAQDALPLRTSFTRVHSVPCDDNVIMCSRPCDHVF